MLTTLYRKDPQTMVDKNIASLVLIVFLLVYNKPVQWTYSNSVIYISLKIPHTGDIESLDQCGS